MLTKKLKPEKKSSSKRINPVDVKDGLRVLKYRAPHEKANHIFKKGAGDAHDDENTPWRKRLPNQTFGYTPCHHPGFTCDEAGDDCSCHVNEYVSSLECHPSLISGRTGHIATSFATASKAATVVSRAATTLAILRTPFTKRRNA